MSSPSEVWAETLRRIQHFVPEQTFEAWFLPTRCAAYSAEGVRIQVPNRLFADWLKENYHTLIVSTLCETLGRAEVTVDYSVSEHPEARAIPATTQNAAPDRTAPAGGISFPPQSGSTQLNRRFSFDSFVVGKSNEFAHAAAQAIAEKPATVYNPLFVYGGVGLGKTHILQAVGNKIQEKNPVSRIHYVSAESFMNEMISSIQRGNTLSFKERYRSVDVLLIDDIQFLAGKESTQEEFFHTFNALYNNHKQIVMTSDRPPKEINLEERLVSRFEWGLVADISLPDLETRIAILRKKAEEEKLSIPDEVLQFIAKSVRSNIRQLEGSLVRLLAFSSLSGQDMDVELARNVLKDFLSQRTNKATIKDIVKIASEEYDVSEEAIMSKRRTAQIALARQVAMYFTRELGGLSLSQIGARFGGRDHSTVLHACQKIERLLKADDHFRNRIDDMAERLTA